MAKPTTAGDFTFSDEPPVRPRAQRRLIGNLIARMACAAAPEQMFCSYGLTETY
jgi:hypothetical protein